MQSLIYDGSFEGFLSAVFDVYEYKFTDADICPASRYNGNLFLPHHAVLTDGERSQRVLKGLEKKLPSENLKEIYRSFLSELPEREKYLLQYIRYAFSSNEKMESDFSHPAVLWVSQTARKVYREKHRMEAFVRFQKTADDLFFSLIEPDYDVLPLIEEHFTSRYADQRWLIYDLKRKYGLYYDLQATAGITLDFIPEAGGGKDLSSVYESSEEKYQSLWQQYFKSVNIASRKNTKLHLQHMPARYWKYLTEKKG